jgi:16S rRNA A1518/A1519 N6-dimethyltransferase RsmA/KsgA/DIM1 with predicted DNA glycosylase/AP lyase activity
MAVHIVANLPYNVGTAPVRGLAGRAVAAAVGR